MLDTLRRIDWRKRWNSHSSVSATKPETSDETQESRRQIPNEIINAIFSYVAREDYRGGWLRISRAFYLDIGSLLYRQITLGYNLREPDGRRLNPLIIRKGNKLVHHIVDRTLMSHLRVLVVHPNAISLCALDIIADGHWTGHSQPRNRYHVPPSCKPWILRFHTLRYYPINISQKHKGTKFGTLHELNTSRLICDTFVLRDLSPNWAIPKPGFNQVIPRDVTKLVMVFNDTKPTTQRWYRDVVNVGGQTIRYCWPLPVFPKHIADLVLIFQTKSPSQSFAWSKVRTHWNLPLHSVGVDFWPSLAIAFSQASYKITLVNVDSFGHDDPHFNAELARSRFRNIVRLYTLSTLKKSQEELEQKQRDVRFLNMEDYLKHEDWEGVFDDEEVSAWGITRDWD